MCVQANFADIYLRGMRDKSMRSGTEFVFFVVLLFLFASINDKFHCRATEFLRSVYLIYLNQYLPAIQTLRRPKNNLNCLPFFFFASSIQFVACVLRENLSNRSSHRSSHSSWVLFVLYEVQLDNKEI